jgi:CBS-domain-containing membrane protein
VIELLEAFKKHRQHLALVIDEHGEIQGLVTMNMAGHVSGVSFRRVAFILAKSACES